jgi:hypothetical protein
MTARLMRILAGNSNFAADDRLSPNPPPGTSRLDPLGWTKWMFQLRNRCG